MTTENQAAFARRIGKARSYITALKNAGRIVMAGDLVDVEASLRMIEQTGGSRPDVAERHAAEKAAPAPQQPAAAQDNDKIGNSYQAARAVKEKYGALKAKAEYETMIGNLIPREDADAAMRFIGAAVRAALEVFPDQTAPLVAHSTDLAEIQDQLTQSCRDALHTVGDAIKRQTAQLTKGPQ